MMFPVDERLRGKPPHRVTAALMRKVHRALEAAGPSTAAELSDRTSVPYWSVQAALALLEDEGRAKRGMRRPPHHRGKWTRVRVVEWRPA